MSVYIVVVLHDPGWTGRRRRRNIAPNESHYLCFSFGAELSNSISDKYSNFIGTTEKLCYWIKNGQQRELERNYYANPDSILWLKYIFILYNSISIRL